MPYNVSVGHVLAELGVSAAITLAMLWLMQPLARKFGILDHPGGRKDHAEPTAATGGLAMAVGVFLTLLWFTDCPPRIIAFMAAASLLVFVGMLDDRHDLRWWVRVLRNAGRYW